MEINGTRPDQAGRRTVDKIGSRRWLTTGLDLAGTIESRLYRGVSRFNSLLECILAHVNAGQGHVVIVSFRVAISASKDEALQRPVSTP